MNSVKPRNEQLCPMCGRKAFGGITHYKCRKPLGLDGLVVACGYRGVVKKLVAKLKYVGVRELAQVVVETLITQADWTSVERGSWQVTEVPLHKRKERQRGFNQSALLAYGLSGDLGWQYIPAVVERWRYTQSQMTLDRAERLVNVRGAFRLGKDQEVAGEWLVVDDVWTTGATMRECGKVLKRAGARKVWGVVVAA